MTKTLLLYNLKLNILIFSISLNSSLIIFIRRYTVNYRNALERLGVRILFQFLSFALYVLKRSATLQLA